ncbi:MAG: hypothetical protein AB7I04_03575 [Pseudomonadales bacterium]
MQVQENAFSSDIRKLKRRRTSLEAKLLAYRIGWLAEDDASERKLQRDLRSVLSLLGNGDPLAATLLQRE